MKNIQNSIDRHGPINNRPRSLDWIKDVVVTISFEEKEKILEVYKDNNLISEIAVNKALLKEGKVDFVIQNDSLLVSKILQSNAKSYPRNLRMADHSDDLTSFSILENGIYVSKKLMF